MIALLVVLALGAGAVGLRVFARASSTTLAAIGVGLLYGNIPVLLAQNVGIPAALVAIVVPALLIASVQRRSSAVRYELPRPFGWLLLYLAAVTVSMLASPIPAGSQGDVLVLLPEAIGLYVLLANACKDVRTLQAVLTTVVVVAAAVSALSVYQAVTTSYHSDFLGFAQHGVDDVNELLGRDSGPARAAGHIGEKNRYAQVLLTVLPVPLIVLLRHPRRRTRFLAFVPVALITAAIALSASRGAAVAAVLTLLTMWLLREIKVRGLVITALVFAVSAAALPAFTERLVSAAAILEEEDGIEETDGAVRGRLSSTLGSMKVFRQHPITGVGLGNYSTFHREAVEDLGLRVAPDRQPHSLLPGIGAETGLVGLVTFLGLLASTAIVLWRVRRDLPRGSPLELISTGLLLGVVAYFFSGIFLHLSYARYLWLHLGLAGATALALRHAR